MEALVKVVSQIHKQWGIDCKAKDFTFAVTRLLQLSVIDRLVETLHPDIWDQCTKVLAEEICLLGRQILIVPRVLYHQEEEMYCFSEEIIQLHKREVVTGPLTMILLILIFGPCILNKLVSFVKSRLEKVNILFVERLFLCTLTMPHVSPSQSPPSTEKPEEKIALEISSPRDEKLAIHCQWYLSSLLSPVCAAVGEAIILHYMDDVLVCAPTDDLLSHVLDLTNDSLVAAGFKLQEEKIQWMLPWKYLGLETGKQTTVPQKLVVKNHIRTLADVQQLCGSLIGHHQSKRMTRPQELVAELIRKARTRIRELAGCAFECIPIPIESGHRGKDPPKSQKGPQQQHQSLKLETPQIQLSKALFTLNFLNCMFENLNPSIAHHFRENCQLQLKAKPPVMVKDPATRETEGPHDLITWGRGYVCVSTPSGLKWVPAKWVKPFIPDCAKPPAEAPQVSSAA
ncbi:hypothetical protein DUI87_03608 [Hirundo rustica rustica]|uniref:Gag-Pol polyprotein n=1 Tax=Hirundo rustica rustica TaxID=333673 RepID=A0A3M0L1Q8_HIRRU|nr:hypothetical protein DUI87_03608 [Hirundo rustica rustica]